MKVVIEYFEPEKCNKTFEDDEKLKNGINWSKMLCLGSNNKTGDTWLVLNILNKNIGLIETHIHSVEVIQAVLCKYITVKCIACTL